MTLVSERHSFKSGAEGAYVLPCELLPVSVTGMSKHYPIQYPRRTISRGVLRQLTGRLINLLADLQTSGLEHVPASGPVILAANHFNFVDPINLLTQGRASQAVTHVWVAGNMRVRNRQITSP